MSKFSRRHILHQRVVSTSPSASPPRSKKEKLVALLRRKEGQALTGLTAALGWLPHTVRAAIAGQRKNGFNVERFTANNGRSRYRIHSEAGR
ncbi:MAG: DUF3489 domain-containing protein [Hyphomonadaceae bacterium]|nr:DUF3489 domain-containing protein [Hyphomonadaceae bacterium]